MSSCAASCCTCFRVASCASVTSASWPTGNALRSCHYASACCRVQQKTYSQPHRLLPIVRTLPHSGTARFAAGPCTSSRGSPRLNCFCFARHPILDYVRHETTSTSSTCPLAAAYTQSLCLVWLRLPSSSSLWDLSGAGTRSLPTPSPTACDLHNPLQSPRKPPGHPQTYSKYIDSHLPGRLPSSRCIRSAPSNTAKQRPLDYRGAPDTALGLRGKCRLAVLTERTRAESCPLLASGTDYWPTMERRCRPRHSRTPVPYSIEKRTIN